MESETVREMRLHIYTVYKRTGLCEYRKVGGVATKMRAILVFHWNIYCYSEWREMEIQRVCRRERRKLRGKRCVFSTTCRLDWRPFFGQWGECSHRPGSTLTHTNDRSACALYCNNTVPFHSTDHTYHTNHNARTHAYAIFQRSPSVSLFLFISHTHTHRHTRRSLTNVGTDAPHQTAVALCSLHTSGETEEYR